MKGDLAQVALTRFEAALEAAFQSVFEDGHSIRPAALITALSGGPDSTALALLASSYAKKHGIRHNCVIVNHGLRADAGNEAKRVAMRMQAMGISCTIQTVTTSPPSGGIQEWARQQRYAALQSAARQIGAVLLLGHHAMDQAETVFMRLMHGSGLDGLGAMSPIRRLGDVSVIRPLLDFMPAELVAICDAFSCEYERDPSNLDARFERVRTRQMLNAMQLAGLPISAHLTWLSNAARDICRHVDDTLAQKLALPRLCIYGYAEFNLGALQDLPDALWRRVIGRTVMAVGGGDYMASQQSFTRLRGRLDAGVPATLGGCRFVLGQGKDEWRILHEPGRLHARSVIGANQPIIFNGIWRVQSPVAGHVRMLGDAPPPPDWTDIAHAVRVSFPVVETLDGGMLYPHLGEVGEAQPENAGLSAVFLALDAKSRHYKECIKGAHIIASDDAGSKTGERRSQR